MLSGCLFKSEIGNQQASKQPQHPESLYIQTRAPPRALAARLAFRIGRSQAGHVRMRLRTAHAQPRRLGPPVLLLGLLLLELAL